MAEISVRNVTKSYGATKIIHGIDIEIADGELIVVVGPSGCGKSTLLRMVAGLEQITGGDIAIGGRVVNNLEPKDRDIAMVFQNYALYPHMTVYNNMAYGLKIAGLGKAEIEARVAKAADILELSELLPRKPKQLSGGQRQRVAMGRAIVRDPAVFLFDEPLSNLDAKLRVQMRLEIKQLQRSLGTTAIYVTHDQVEAMTLADRLVVMNQGLAEQIDTPLAVYERPASLFVAGFIGSPAMNFMPARVAANGAAITLDSGATVSTHGANLAALAGRSLTLGFRPEHLRPAGSNGAGSNGAGSMGAGEAEADLRMTVTVVETLGADTLAHGHIGSNQEALTARLPGIAKVKAGDTLPLTVNKGALHLFDSDSGKRLADL